MRVTYPDYYETFHCIGSACKDNCCIGWEIDVDPVSAARYQAADAELGQRLREGIQWDDPPYFKRKEKERCCFLNEQNLCDIQCALGEEGLCEICRQHPRFHEWFGDYKESGLGLCCEAVGALLFSREEPVSFVQSDIPEPPDEDEPDKRLLQAVLRIRETAFGIAQDRGLPMGIRLCLLMELAQASQFCLDREDMECLDQVCSQFSLIQCRREMGGIVRLEEGSALEETWRGMLRFLRHQTPLESSWPERIRRLEENVSSLLSQARDFSNILKSRIQEVEHLAVYFLYRYLLKAAYDGDVLSKTGFTVTSCLTVGLMAVERWQETGDFTMEDHIQLAKDYSKQVEYDLDNVTGLMEAMWCEPWADVRHLTGMCISLFLPDKEKGC